MTEKQQDKPRYSLRSAASPRQGGHGSENKTPGPRAHLVSPNIQAMAYQESGLLITLSLLNSSVGKESSRNAEDPGSIPGLGRSSGEGIGYPFQYSWASLVAQLVKNQPAGVF